MKAKRISSVVIMTIVLCSMLYIILRGFLHTGINPQEVFPLTPQKLESFFQENFPLGDTLKEMVVALRYSIGAKEQNGVFIAEGYLLKNVTEPDEGIVQQNTKALLQFADNYRVPTYSMIIPTACAIKQKNLDQLAQTQLYNQKAFIEDVYRKYEGKISAVNVYPTLFAQNENYIYYRTESNLTSLGGYYIYETLGSRLNLKPAGLERFEIEYYPYHYLGDVYDMSPYKDIMPDVLSAYHFSKFRREYRVTRRVGETKNTYYQLYPEESVSYKNAMNVFLGGMADQIDIEVAAPNDTKLLLYGDKSALSYLPFLAIHYKHITFVNLETATQKQLSEIDIKGYDQVLFGFSADTYMHKNFGEKLTQK